MWTKSHRWDWWDERFSGGDWAPQRGKDCFIHCQEISLKNSGVDRLQRTLRGCWAEQMPFNSVLVFLGHQAPLLRSHRSHRIPGDREPRDPVLLILGATLCVPTCMTFHLPSFCWLPLLHHWCRERLVWLGVPVRLPSLGLTCPASSIKVAFLLEGWFVWLSEPLVFNNQSKNSMKSVASFAYLNEMLLISWYFPPSDSEHFSFFWTVKNLHPPNNKNIVWWTRIWCLEPDYLVLNLVLLLLSCGILGHTFFNPPNKNMYL